MSPDGGGERNHPRIGGEDRQAAGQQLQEADEAGEAALPSSAHRDHSQVGQKAGKGCTGVMFPSLHGAQERDWIHLLYS